MSAAKHLALWNRKRLSLRDERCGALSYMGPGARGNQTSFGHVMAHVRLWCPRTACARADVPGMRALEASECTSVGGGRAPPGRPSDEGGSHPGSEMRTPCSGLCGSRLPHMRRCLNFSCAYGHCFGRLTSLHMIATHLSAAAAARLLPSRVPHDRFDRANLLASHSTLSPPTSLGQRALVRWDSPLRHSGRRPRLAAGSALDCVH